MARELQVETGSGRARIPVGQARAFGRDADIVLRQRSGREDSDLHGRAFEILALDDRWVVSVPAGNHNPVNVETPDGVSTAVHAGTDRGFRSDRAEVHVWTDLEIHRVRIVAPWLPPVTPQRSGTRRPELTLSPADRNQRVWIMACAPLLTGESPASLEWTVVAARLRAAGNWEDRALTPVAVRQRAQRARPEIDAWMDNRRWPVPGALDREAVCEFLVRFGAVTVVEVGALSAPPVPDPAAGERCR
jgi:hypothetical protein